MAVARRYLLYEDRGCVDSPIRDCGQQFDARIFSRWGFHNAVSLPRDGDCRCRPIQLHNKRPVIPLVLFPAQNILVKHKLNVASFSVSMWWQPSTFHKVIRHLFVLDHRNAIGYRKISFLNRQFVVCLTPCSIFSVSSSNPERNRIDNAVKPRRRNTPARDPSTKS